MANDGLLDVDAIRETMKDAPLSAQDHLENMLKTANPKVQQI